MKYKYRDCIPPGMNMNKIYEKILVLFAIPIVFSFQFFYYFEQAKLEQIEYASQPGKWMAMANFVEVIGNSFVLYPLAIVGCLAVAIPLYGYFYQESKSIYLMKRLENPHELWRRTLTIPIVAATIMGVVSILILVLYYWYYISFSPMGSVEPNQWNILIETWLKGGLV